MSGRVDVENGKLIYTCNCGWIDRNHSFARSSDPYVGADNLWAQFNRCTFEALYTKQTFFDPAPVNVRLPPDVIRLCRADRKARFADGETGYPVRYKQHMGNRLIKSSTERHYLIRKNLTPRQSKSVALAIFMDVSREFEATQSNWFWGLLTDSGFSQEDLVSNLIGFYIAIGEMSQQTALRLCHPVDTGEALQIWDANGSVGANKNETFSPVFAPNTGINDNVRQVCRNACHGQSQSFPKEFKTLNPEPYGSLFVRYPNLY